MTELLQTAGLLHQASVTALRTESLVGKTSFNAQVSRLHLTYDHKETGSPTTLIAKAPTETLALAAFGVALQPSAKESWFYDHGTTQVPLAVPCCYYNVIDKATGKALLLLEDLSPAQPGDQVKGASLESAQLALLSLARLHAAWWDNASLISIKALVDVTVQQPEVDNLIEQLYAQRWPLFLRQTDFVIPNEVRRFGTQLIRHTGGVNDLLKAAPETLVHGDFRLENLLFGVSQGAPICWVIDWEDFFVGSGMVDVAWFLGSGLPLLLADQEEPLLHFYQQALVKFGVNGYTFAQCYQDYRRAMVSLFIQGVFMATPANLDRQHDRNLARAVGERFVAACQRLHLSALI